MWAQTLDYFKFKIVIVILFALQATLAATVFFIADYRYLYLIWICLSFGCQGGVMSICASACSKIYGAAMGGKMTAITIYCFGTSGILCGII